MPRRRSGDQIVPHFMVITAEDIEMAERELPEEGLFRYSRSRINRAFRLERNALRDQERTPEMPPPSPVMDGTYYNDSSISYNTATCDESELPLHHAAHPTANTASSDVFSDRTESFGSPGQPFSDQMEDIEMETTTATAKTGTETQVERKIETDIETEAGFKTFLTNMIRKMMFVSGETAEPSIETTTLIEELTRQQVLEIVSIASHVA